MKQLKITLKHVMLIVALTFSAISCQKEEVIQTEVIRIENQTSNYKIQNIGKDIISKNKILSEKLLAFSSKSTDKNSSMSLRDVYNEAYDFTIETDQAIYIENSQYHSYTFTIYRDEPNNLVENLVFSLQDDGSYKTILMKYSLTNEDINAILNNEETQISYDNKVDWETLDINLDGLLYKNYQIGNNLYYNSDSGYCYKEIGIISAATGWEDTQQQVVDCPNDLDTEHFSEDDGGGFTTTNNPDTDPTDTSDPNEGETGNTGNTSNPGNTGNNPPADITTPNISISEQILNCLNSNININNPVYITNADLRNSGLNLSDMLNYLDQNECSSEAQVEMIAMIKLISGMEKECQAMEVFRSIFRINSTFTNNIKNYFLLSNDNNLNLQDLDTGESVSDEPPMPANVGARVLPEPGSDGTIILQFNNTNLDTATTLGYVNTFYHELVHAYILHLYHSGELLNEYPAYTDLKTAMDNFFNNSTNTTIANIYDKEMHDIYIDFIDQIAESIVAYCDYNNINGIDLVYAKKLVWGGLNGYDVFNDNLTPTQRLEAQTLLAHENFNNTSNAKGTKTCN